MTAVIGLLRNTSEGERRRLSTPHLSTAGMSTVAAQYGKETAEYMEFGEAAEKCSPGGAGAARSTSTATTVRVKGGKGGDVVTAIRN